MAAVWRHPGIGPDPLALQLALKVGMSVNNMPFIDSSQIKTGQLRVGPGTVKGFVVIRRIYLVGINY